MRKEGADIMCTGSINETGTFFKHSTRNCQRGGKRLWQILMKLYLRSSRRLDIFRELSVGIPFVPGTREALGRFRS